ncbi:hypothetical protein [Chitinophaga agrisoli]|uniref:hypothetical protein n=1 Tax=Chitinophaga agrisoli TaxID=2607653 RepID=UPI00122E4BAB|nr:hypothetical protein [Chitinophaga agrisoli]
MDKAVIKVPITARITRAGRVITESADTAKKFDEGDKVIIKLGYNSQLQTEFEGFISRINFTSPLEIECEGYSYQLRNMTYTKTFVHAQLLDILKYLVASTDIALDEKNIPSLIIEKLLLQGHNGCEALDEIKKITHGTIRAFFRGNMLFMGLVLTDQLSRTTVKPDAIYRLGWNVVKDDNLKLRQAKNQDVTVKFLGIHKSGDVQQAEESTDVLFLPGKSKKVKTTGTAGDEGETKIVKTRSVIDKDSLNKLAKELHTSLSYTGYEGKITAFLQPFCRPAQRVEIRDTKYPERNGVYLVESTEVSYGTNGARRVIGIGIKL